jgi:hypothetical protein
VIIREVAHQSTTFPIVLYAIGFVMQVLGGVIVVLEIRDDRRAAKRLPDGGLTWETVEAAPEAIKRRLNARGWRIAGVALIFAGAAVGLAANLLALQA